MAFKKVGGPKKYIKYSEYKSGDVLVEGKYLGTVPNKYNADRPNFEFKTKDGVHVVLNTTGKLNYLIESYVKEGDDVQVF